MKTWRLMVRVRREPAPPVTYWTRWDLHRSGVEYPVQVANPEPMDEYLLCLGDSREDCIATLNLNLPDFTLEAVKRWAYLWLEEWRFDPWFDRHAWQAVEEVSIGRLKKRLGIIKYHARKREAAAC